MRIKGAKQIHYDSGPNMTPLVDVVMVILIFLMMTGSFTGAEHYLISKQAIQTGGLGSAPPPPGYIPDEPLDIRVDRTDAGFRARVGQIQTTDSDTLREQLTTLRENFQSAGTKLDKVQVRISPGKNVSYDALIGVYEAALRAGFEKVAFTTAH